MVICSQVRLIIFTEAVVTEKPHTWCALSAATGYNFEIICVRKNKT